MGGKSIKVTEENVENAFVIKSTEYFQYKTPEQVDEFDFIKFRTCVHQRPQDQLPPGANGLVETSQYLDQKRQFPWNSSPGGVHQPLGAPKSLSGDPESSFIRQ